MRSSLENLLFIVVIGNIMLMLLWYETLFVGHSPLKWIVALSIGTVAIWITTFLFIKNRMKK